MLLISHSRTAFRHALLLSPALLPLLAGAAGAQQAAVSPAVPTAAAPGTGGDSELVSVVGQRRPGLVATGSSAATKTETKLIDTPESVSTITRAQLDQQDARNLGEALRYSAGISGEADRGYSTRYDLVSIRGFQGSGGDEFLDGLRLFNGAFYASQQIDTFLLDRIDVLKGPPSVLYGQSNPGGVIALTSKLPTAEPVRLLSIEGGSFGYVRGTADLGGRLNPAGTLLYRLAATVTTSGSQDRHTGSDRYAVLPSVSWVPDDRTTLTLDALYQHDPRGGNYDTAPLQGTILPNPNGKLPNSLYTGDDNFETFDRTQGAVGYQLSHRLDDRWTLRSVARYAAVGSDYRQVYGGTLDDDDHTYPRSTAASKENYDTITLEEQVLAHLDTGPVHHALLAGANWQNLRDSYTFLGGTAPAIDVFAPNNDQAIPEPALEIDTSVTTNQEAIFAEDQATFGRWHLQLGGREDWSEIATRNALYGGGFDQGDRAFTWRAGILYALPIGLSPYFNYARSFQPANALAFNGTPFKPTRGEQYEVGLKYQPARFNGFFTAALYDLKESNVLVADPDHLFFSVQTGAIRSRGAELEAHAALTREINLIASYTYQDVRYGAGSGALAGRRPTQVPAQFFSLWGHYDVRDGRLRGLGFGAGVRYNGDTLADQAVEYVTPSYTLVDAQAQYALGGLLPALRNANLQVTAQNLLDHRYVSSCYSASFGCFFGAGRNVIGRLTYGW